MLANHKGVQKPEASPFFAYTMPRLAPYDPTRYQENIKVRDEFSLQIKEECQEMPFEVVFEKKSKPVFFDLNEMPQEQIPAD